MSVLQSVEFGGFTNESLEYASISNSESISASFTFYHMGIIPFPIWMDIIQ